MSKSNFDPANLSRDELVKVVRHVTDCHPRDIQAQLKGTVDVFEWLTDLFEAIDNSIDTGATDKAKRFAGLGKYLSQDYGNYTDGVADAVARSVVSTIGKGGY